MGLFNKLFAKANSTNEAQTEKVEPSLGSTDFTPISFQDLFEQFAGIAYEKQLALVDIIGDKDFNVDIRQGTISFGADLVCLMDIYGTIAHANQTWLWAWANTQSNLPHELLAKSELLKQYGQDHNIDVLVQEQIPFSKQEMHMLGLIASGMFNSKGYYIADYGSGAMLVTLFGDDLDEHDNPYGVLTTFPQLISQFDLNHKSALKHYLLAKGYSLSSSGANSIIGTKEQETIHAEFDGQGRLMKLTN